MRRALPTGLVFALALGFAAAVVDFFLRDAAKLATDARALLGASILYSTPLLLVALTLVLWRRSAGRVPAVLGPLALLIVLGGLANILWLPEQTSRRSLAFDAGFLAVAGLLSLAAHRLPAAGKRALWVASMGLAAGLGNAIYWARPSVPTSAGAAVPAAQGVPDLIVVLFDALRADHTSLHGYERDTTPNLRALAAESIVFERAYAPSSWTKPSVATLFTGVLPASHVNHRISSHLPEALPTLPELLAAQGYRSGVFAENSFVSALFGFDRGVDRILTDEADVAAQTTLGHVLFQLAPRSRAAAVLYDLAELCNRFDPRHRLLTRGGLDVIASSIAWLDEQEAEQPVFLYVHLMKPHAPYSCPPPFDGRFGGAAGPLRPPRVEGLGVFAQAPQLEATERAALVANYDERILYGDALFGQLLRALRERGRLDGALLIALADHGEEFGENGLWDHGHSLQEGVLRIPLLVKLPAAQQGGRRIESIVRLVDVPATLAAAAGVPKPPQFAGVDLRERLDPHATSGELSVLAEVRHGPGYEMHALLAGRDKLVQTLEAAREFWQLFQLESDPLEAENRLPQDSALADSLRRQMELALLTAAMHRHGEGDVELDPHTLERLRALGYVE